MSIAHSSLMRDGRGRGMGDRDHLVDGSLILALGMVASVGFRETYNGWTYLMASGAGLLIGILLAHLATLLERPAVVVAVFVAVGFFLFGGAVALHTEGALAVVPLPDTLVELSNQAIHGWKDLLTTRAPIDGGPLLTLPYLMGLVAGASGMTLASRIRSVFWPMVAPIVLLAAVILLGVQSPQRLVVMGAVFAVLALTWIAVRARRLNRRVIKGGSAWRRRGAAALLVAVSAAAAPVIGPLMPGADARDRVVLRTHVTPPFDVGQYPSPLSGFRRYTKGYRVPEGDVTAKLYDRELLRVDGLPGGTRLRFAALDKYTGTAWGAANQAPDVSGADGQFQRVGSAIRDEGPGRPHRATVTLADDFDGVWLPTTGAVQRLEFHGADADQLSASFRYNLATDTGIVPQGLHGGASYTFTAQVAGEQDRLSASMTPSNQSLSIDESGIDYRPVGQRWGGDAGGLEQLLAIVRHLDEKGYYTDGGAEGDAPYPAGHSTRRLSDFTAQDEQTAGNDEQYAATVALLGTQLGLPVRVVMGAVVPDSGVVKGKDVHAWVEVKDSSGIWREIAYDQFLPPYDRPPENNPPSDQELTAGTVIPPPAPVRPPSTAGDPLPTDDNRRGKQKGGDDGWLSLPAWLVAGLKYVGAPLLGIALILGSVVLAKSLRRRRRRTRGAPTTRLTAAWRELLDGARDFGQVVHGRRTRREQAAQLGLSGAAALARAADSHVFGRLVPTDTDVASYWTDVDALRSELASGRTRWQRFRAAISPRSFRPLPVTEPEVGG